MHLRALLKVYGNASQVNTVILGNTMPFIVYRTETAKMYE